METSSVNLTQRRSSRFLASVLVRARGVNTAGRKFRENSRSVVISMHGGLIYIRAAVQLGAEMVLVNPATEEEQECRVVYLGDSSDKGTRVGVEFLSPSPHFWGVEFTQQS